jgi:hypothetical protein
MLRLYVRIVYDPQIIRHMCWGDFTIRGLSDVCAIFVY